MTKLNKMVSRKRCHPDWVPVSVSACSYEPLCWFIEKLTHAHTLQVYKIYKVCLVAVRKILEIMNQCVILHYLE